MLRTQLLSSVVGFALFVSQIETAAAQTYYVIPGISDGYLNMREGPSTRFDVVAQIPSETGGIHIIRCEQSNNGGKDWCLATWDGFKGWISSCCILREDVADAPPARQDQPDGSQLRRSREYQLERERAEAEEAEAADRERNRRNRDAAGQMLGGILGAITNSPMPSFGPSAGRGGGRQPSYGSTSNSGSTYSAPTVSIGQGGCITSYKTRPGVRRQESIKDPAGLRSNC